MFYDYNAAPDAPRWVTLTVVQKIAWIEKYLVADAQKTSIAAAQIAAAEQATSASLRSRGLID